MFADLLHLNSLVGSTTSSVQGSFPIGVVAPEWKKPEGVQRHYNAAFFTSGVAQAESHGVPGVLDMSGFHTPCFIGHSRPKGGGFVNGERYCDRQVGGPGVFGFGRLHFPTQQTATE